MRRAPAPSPLRTRFGLAAVVLCLHVLGLLLVMRLAAWADRAQAPPQSPSLVWLQLSARAAAPSPAAPPQARHAVSKVPARRPREPQAITLPAASQSARTEVPPADPPALPSPAVAASASAEPPPLNLALPLGASAPWRQRNPALDDPRVHSPPATVDSRIAAALGGSDRITQEHLEGGRIRFRRGNECVVAHPNRAERIDPFNASVSPKPRPMEKC